MNTSKIDPALEASKIQRVIRFTTCCPHCSEPMDILLDHKLIEVLHQSFSMSKDEAAVVVEKYARA